MESDSIRLRGDEAVSLYNRVISAATGTTTKSEASILLNHDGTYPQINISTYLRMDDPELGGAAGSTMSSGSSSLSMGVQSVDLNSDYLHVRAGYELDLEATSGDITMTTGNYVNLVGYSQIQFKDLAYTTTYSRFYYRAGDTITFNIKIAGYIASSSATVYFTVPISRPIIGSPTAAAASVDGFILRQRNSSTGGSYTHGSAASTRVKPSSYSTVAGVNYLSLIHI